MPNSEISALTQSEVLEAVVHESSDDGEFATKLISPQNTPKRYRYRCNDEDAEASKTPTICDPSHCNNIALMKQIAAQNTLISDLQRKLKTIEEVTRDVMCTDNVCSLGTVDGSEKNEVVGSGAGAVTHPKTTIINLHFN